MKADMQQYAARGASLLDEQVPGWHNKINTDTLNMRSVRCCILGQLFDRYDLGLRRLSKPNLLLCDFSELYCMQYGFTLHPENYRSADSCWDSLGSCWKYEITIRKEGDSVGNNTNTC